MERQQSDDSKVMFLITGMTGEYSDRNEWPVAVYSDRAQAETHVLLASAWLRERGLYDDDGVRRTVAYHKRQVAAMNPYDTSCACDYTGTRYGISEVTYREMAPTAEVRA